MGWLRINLNCKLMSRCAVLRRRHPINIIHIPARELTHPTFVNGNSSSKVPAGTGICSFPRRVYMYVYMPHYATWKVDSWHSVPLNLVYDDTTFLTKNTTKLGSGNQHLVYHRILYSVPPLHSGKLTQQWKMDTLKMYFLLNMGIFHYIAMLV